MGRYEVRNQYDFIIVPRQDVLLDCSGTDHRVYIKVRNMAALDNIIEQCEAIKWEMLNPSEG